MDSSQEPFSEPCFCHSLQPYEVCCKRFHDGDLPQDARLLMRSRFAAYSLDLPDYIISTTHPGSTHYFPNKFSWKRSLSQFSRNTQFQKLEILDFKEKGVMASVTFMAMLSQNGEDVSFTERSYFEKKNGRWLYLEGIMEKGFAPHIVPTDELKLLPLAYYGEEILRQKAEPVAAITPEVKGLIESMVQTMDSLKGMGLAAPQVHCALRIFIIRLLDEAEERLGELKVFINPVLSSPSTTSWVAPEGCLSIPRLRAEVKRPKDVLVEYTNLEGDRLQEKFSGWAAKAIFHEYDHLEGTLFFDHLEPEEKEKFSLSLKRLQTQLAL